MAWHPARVPQLSAGPPVGWQVLPSLRAAPVTLAGGCLDATPQGTGEQGSRGRGEEGRRDAGGRRVAGQAQVASWLSTGILLPQPPSLYCW